MCENNYDIYSDIENTTDIDYLIKLSNYVDEDIWNIGKDSDIIKLMKAKMINTTVDEMEKKQLDYFNDLKIKIKNRISKITEK